MPQFLGESTLLLGWNQRKERKFRMSQQQIKQPLATSKIYFHLRELGI